ADVRVAELLERVEERARTVDAGGRVDDFVAVHSAAAAFAFVLRAQWQLARPDRRLLVRLHGRIVVVEGRAAQDLTSPRRKARGYARRRARVRTASWVND